MTATSEQRSWARLAGLMIFANIVLQGFGDAVTIIGRGDYAEKARFAAEHATLWRFSLLNVGASWIALGVLAFALCVVLEPVHRRLAQLALVLRLGAVFVGAGSLMFRVAQARLYQEAQAGSVFTTEQLRILVAASQQGANGGVWTSWMFLGTGSMLFFLLFLRSRYLPGLLARLGIIGSAMLVATTLVMFVFPQGTNWLKAFALPGLVVDVATALWLLTKGLPHAPDGEAAPTARLGRATT